MFSFFKTKTKHASSSHPSQHRPSRSIHTTNDSNLEAGYDDVSLEAGDNTRSLNSYDRGTNFSSTPHSASTSSFVGGQQQSSSSASYPPQQSSVRPSPSSGYQSLRSTFARLESHLAEASPSLLDSLALPLPPNSPALQSLIDAISPYRLPPSVLEAYALHDGQDPFASATDGLVFGLWWMPIDLVETEWRFWRKFEDAGGSGGMEDAFSASTEGRKSMRPSFEDRQSNGYDPENEEESGDGGGGTGMEGMRSCPKGWIRTRYSHPGWLPLLTDRAGNYVGVDLDPPLPMQFKGKKALQGSEDQEGYGIAGQVIAFGREIDEKVVLFPGDSAGGWGRFLAGFVDDLERGEFARLGEKKKSSSNGWGGSEKRGSSSDDDEWGAGDGIGETSYIDGDRYGDEGESGASEEHLWTLRSQFRRWLSQEGEGGIVGALAESSRRKWRAMGVGSTSPIGIAIPPPRSPLSVEVPEEGALESGPESATTERAPSPHFFSSNQPSQEESDPSSSAHPHPLDSNSQNVTPPMPSNDQLLLSPPSPRSVAAARRAESSRSRERSVPRRRPPPPAPMPIELPTMFDLDDSPTSSSSSTNRYSEASSPGEQTYRTPQLDHSHNFPNVTLTPTRESLLPLSKSSASSSTTALVPADDGSGLSLAGLGLGIGMQNGHDREESENTLEIVVDPNSAMWIDGSSR